MLLVCPKTVPHYNSSKMHFRRNSSWGNNRRNDNRFSNKKKNNLVPCYIQPKSRTFLQASFGSENRINDVKTSEVDFRAQFDIRNLIVHKLSKSVFNSFTLIKVGLEDKITLNWWGLSKTMRVVFWNLPEANIFGFGLKIPRASMFHGRLGSHFSWCEFN